MEDTITYRKGQGTEICTQSTWAWRPFTHVRTHGNPEKIYIYVAYIFIYLMAKTVFNKMKSARQSIFSPAEPTIVDIKTKCITKYSAPVSIQSPLFPSSLIW